MTETPSRDELIAALARGWEVSGGEESVFEHQADAVLDAFIVTQRPNA